MSGRRTGRTAGLRTRWHALHIGPPADVAATCLPKTGAEDPGVGGPVTVRVVRDVGLRRRGSRPPTVHVHGERQRAVGVLPALHTTMPHLATRGPHVGDPVDVSG